MNRCAALLVALCVTGCERGHCPPEPSPIGSTLDGSTDDAGRGPTALTFAKLRIKLNGPPPAGVEVPDVPDGPVDLRGAPKAICSVMPALGPDGIEPRGRSIHCDEAQGRSYGHFFCPATSLQKELHIGSFMVNLNLAAGRVLPHGFHAYCEYRR